MMQINLERHFTTNDVSSLIEKYSKTRVQNSLQYNHPLWKDHQYHNEALAGSICCMKYMIFAFKRKVGMLM